MPAVADRVEVVVVGGGLAGLTATVGLAQAGVPVRLYDRGQFEGRPGGGLVSGATLEPLGGPEVRQDVPYDREVSDRRWLFLSAEGEVALDFLDLPPPLASEGLHTVRTSTLTPWLAARARTLGADLRPGSNVTALQRDARGRVTGVVVDGASVEAEVTIVSDGGGLIGPPSSAAPPATIGVAESYWSLPAATVTARFGGRARQGTVLEMLLGELSREAPAGGYLVPFRSGAALGVVAPLGAQGPGAVLSLLERLESHPSIARLLRGGTRSSPRTTTLSDQPEIGRPLSGAGFLAAGTAGGLLGATGTRFLSVDAALRSGTIAAEVARDAVQNHDSSAFRLRSYRVHLAADGLLDELRRARASGRRYRAAPGVARDVPRLMNTLFHELMSESGGPKRRVLPTVRSVRRAERVSRRTLARAALIAGRWT